MTPDDPWDDERLQAAFEAHASGHPTPVDLAASTVTAIRTGTARRTPSRLAWPLAAAAAIVVVIGGLAIAGLASRAPNRGTVSPSDITATPSSATQVPSPATPSTEAPTQVAGLPVISVDEAIAIRDAGLDDREIAVRGWFSSPGPIPCPAPPVPPLSPLQMVCPDAFTWLMEDQERLVTIEGNATGSRPPSGPALNPKFEPSVTRWMPATPDTGTLDPVDVVLIGHFDDRRSTECPVEDVATCRDRFVVDRVETANDRPVDWAIAVTDATPLPPVDPVLETIREIDPDGMVLSMVFVDHATLVAEMSTFLDMMDPDPLVLIPSYIWRVKVLDAGRAVTYLVHGDSDRVFRITDGGDLIRVDAGATVATPAPWPPDNATIITLTSQVGTGRLPVRVAVVDRSGSLKNVREVPDGRIPPGIVPPETGRFWVAGDPDDPRRIYLVWTGGPCDSRATVTIESLDSILLDGGPQPECDAVGIGRGLILTFEDPVDPSLFDVGYKETRIVE